MTPITLLLCSIIIIYGTAAQQCPKLSPGTIGICVERCSDDEDCATGQKCCSNGCGHTCQRAVSVVPLCPPVCSLACTGGLVLKEDKNGCKLCQCVHPCENERCPLGTVCKLQPVQCFRAPCFPVPRCVPNGNLRCPALDPGTVGICVEGCSSDRSCRFGYKCCSNGCGHVCRRAVPDAKTTPLNCPPVCSIECPGGLVLKEDKNRCKLCQCVDRCQNEKCPRGTRCVLRHVQCVRAPCYPVPECVPNSWI